MDNLFSAPGLVPTWMKAGSTSYQRYALESTIVDEVGFLIRVFNNLGGGGVLFFLGEGSSP